MATLRAFDLLPEERAAEPFHLSEAWARCWAEAYGEGRPILFDAGEARLRTALLPDRFGPLLASTTNLQTCYFDLAGGAAPAAELDRLPARLLGTGAAQVRIDWLGEGARLLEAARAWRTGHLVTIDPFALSPIADCGRPFEAYLEDGGKSLRKYWKACRRHILEGPLALDFVTGGSGLGRCSRRCSRSRRQDGRAARARRYSPSRRTGASTRRSRTKPQPRARCASPPSGRGGACSPTNIAWWRATPSWR
jgi:hypothetical protein